MRAAFGLLALLASGGAAAAAPCEPAAPCTVASGTYVARTPAGWDGIAALDVLVVFHGYGATGANMLDNQGLAELADQHALLVVAPNGLVDERGRTTWSNQGSPTQDRDEHAFVREILADVDVRFPISPRLPTFTGFSHGSSMVWDLACTEGAAFGRYVAIAGGFWDPMPQRCASPIGNVTHLHGTADAVVPLQGRPIGDRWHQGDLIVGWQRFVEAASCPGTTMPMAAPEGKTCTAWTGCSGGALTFCLHDGGHDFDLSMLARVLDGPS